MKPKLNWNRNVPESYVQLTRKITPSNLNKMKQNHVSDLDSLWSIHRHVASFLKWEGGRLILNKILTSKKKVRGWKDIFLNPFPLAKSDADQKTLASKDVRKILFVVGRGVGATSIPLASTFHCLFTCFQIDFLHGAIKIGRGATTCKFNFCMKI